MDDSVDNQKDQNLKVRIQKLLGKEITKFSLKGRGACNDAYYIETVAGGRFMVKEERKKKEFQPQNTLIVEANVAQQLFRLKPFISVPHVVFISENPNMYGYEYIEGDMLKIVWNTLAEDKKISICHKLGQFHADIGKKFNKEMATRCGIKINPSLGLHPDVEIAYEAILSSSDIPQGYKVFAKKAKIIFEETADHGLFQFLHNDSHHENILIKDGVISGIIDFGEAEYGEVAKEFSRYIRDFPDHFQYIVSAYIEASGNKLPYKRLVANAFLSGFMDIIENYRKGGGERVEAENSISTYRRLMI
jgi:aminoglycoside phosphotransferase (APT) family kinase protein